MKHLTALLLAGVLAGQANAEANLSPKELDGLIRAERPSGCADYSYLFWDFYRAELWSDAPSLPGDRYALSLTYRSDFTRDDLVESSIDEMVRMSGQPEETFVNARAQMEQVFRSVVPGDRITAWREAGDRVRFFHNGAETGTLTEQVDLFLDIWLGTRTRDPDGRRALLSGKCDG